MSTFLLQDVAPVTLAQDFDSAPAARVSTLTGSVPVSVDQDFNPSVDPWAVVYWGGLSTTAFEDAGIPAITGTGAVSQVVAAPGASATLTFSGTVTTTQPTPTLSTSGVLLFTSTSASTQATGAVSGTGTLGFTSTVNLTQLAAVLAGQGGQTFSGALASTQTVAAIETAGALGFLASAALTQSTATLVGEGSIDVLPDPIAGVIASGQAAAVLRAQGLALPQHGRGYCLRYPKMPKYRT
jgi:hypothetical protein